eukprot:TRINITY_DN32599_c0_g1_i1.p1 TRINITY_DN32599_c0_g1~~TRINITY_DN32599_c0_g1_i1.p1  ORF type:complete len:209 (-),score=3.07 TRINITY_DN32599_c0_g1_i1:94-720(-)
MSSTRFSEGTNQTTGAWKERIRLEDRTAKLVALNLAADADVKAPYAFDPKQKPNVSRFGAKGFGNAQSPLSHSTQILPHLVSEADRKKLLEQAAAISSGIDPSLPPVPATPSQMSGRSSRTSRSSRPPSQASLGSRRSRQTPSMYSSQSHGSMDSRLERLEADLQHERQGRLDVQDQLMHLRKLMENHFKGGDSTPGSYRPPSSSVSR